jgi:prepilin-type N-terminal cleavage/methylation domain-containing protein
MLAAQRTSSRAFTLIELILVMLIIAIALAMAAPNLRGWSHGSQLRNAGDQFLTLTRYANAQAISEGKKYRHKDDPGQGRYWITVQQGQDQFVNVTSEFGQVYSMPEGMQITLSDLQSKPVDSVDFYPSGRVTPAHVRIAGSAEVGAVDIEAATPAEGFSYVTQQQGAS